MIIKSYKVKFAFAILLGLGFISCDKLFIEPDPKDYSQKSFEIFWSDINNTYPFFQYDKVDWKEMYELYRPQVTSNTSGFELFQIFTKMLRPLSDGHISLTYKDKTWTNERYRQYAIDNPFQLDNNYFFKNVKNNYLNNNETKETWPNFIEVNKRDTVLVFGMINNDILYFKVETFLTTYPYEKKIDSLIKAIPNIRGMILDLRSNGGGSAQTMEKLASVLINNRVRYGTYKEKIGPLPESFGPPEDMTVFPNPGLKRFINRIAVLTNRYSVSATEHMVLVLKGQPNVRVIGDTTAGAFSPITQRTLPNGMEYTIVNGIVTDRYGAIYEKLGIPPDETIILTESHYNQGKDPLIDKGIQFIGQ